MPALRVIDVIAALQNHDPVAPFEVWSIDGRGELIVARGFEVFQASPLYLKAKGIEYERQDKSGPFPVVLNIIES